MIRFLLLCKCTASLLCGMSAMSPGTVPLHVAKCNENTGSEPNLVFHKTWQSTKENPIMNLRNQIQLVIISSALPLVPSASFECSVNELGVTNSDSVCCRTSKEFGLTSCESGPQPRRVVAVFEIPEIRTHIKALDDAVERANVRGRYGVLAQDAHALDGGNKVSCIHMLEAMHRIACYLKLTSSIVL